MTDNLRARAEKWTEDEIAKRCFGEEYGYAVTLAMAVMPGPAGPQQLPMWMVLLTARSPLVGEGPLYHGPVPVGVGTPREDTIRAEVGKGLRQLRDLAASKLAGQNGHPKAPAAPG